MLEKALNRNGSGPPARTGRTHSTDWDEIQEFCKAVYMPYRVRPLERLSRPDATMLSAKAGRVTMTRFSYGTGIHLDQFDPDAGNILVLNTIRGTLSHKYDSQPATTRAGESLVVDCSRTDYWLDGDPEHMQFNLTIPHDLMGETAERWFGFIPDDTLWTRRLKFGGPQSPWLRLLEYAAQAVNRPIPIPGDGVLGRHLEEIMCLELLREWAVGAGIRLDLGARAAAPYYVRRAEEILEAEAREAPTIGEVARRVGVSARTLSGGFRRFRGFTPRDFLAARRLEGFRADLETASADRSIGHIASDWGFVNFGALAGLYRERYGELPSQTRARARVIR
ncbi:MAG: AraC family transcriptional regulator [Rhodospirillum sp.]|nr:AraC family transcriptional regulator [Rhodospirillum sp.]MCF8489686.1 AraC family transcriptional regulator [Rhodospirillum sp.]MCF8502288.1 AraC family transcriptional regulator [Rhodospirillum sp.]